MSRQAPLFLDTETSGLSRSARLCEVAVVDGQGEVLFDSLVRPDPFPDLSHHVSLATTDFGTAPSMRSLAARLFALLADRTVWSYNSAFDRSVLWREWSLLERPAPRCQWRCAAELVGELAGSRLSLRQAARFLDIDVDVKTRWHRAREDASLLRLVVQRALRFGDGRTLD